MHETYYKVQALKTNANAITGGWGVGCNYN